MLGKNVAGLHHQLIIRTRQVVPSGVHSRHVLGPRDSQLVFLYGMEGKYSVFHCNNT
jgi:hypothetical protein